MRYSLFVHHVDWRKVAEYEAIDAVDALAHAARALLPNQHDSPILVQPADRPGPEALDRQTLAAAPC